MKKVTKKWTQKDGTKIRICDMTDSHLNNTIKMLERAAKKSRDLSLTAAYSCSCMFGQDSMASFLCDQDIDIMEDDENGETFLHDLYDDLCDEKARREYIKFQEENESKILDDCVVGGCDRYGSLQN